MVRVGRASMTMATADKLAAANTGNRAPTTRQHFP
jgi:hypothetical protein